MTAAEDLVRRYLALWQDYVAALLADLATPEVVRHWADSWSARMEDLGAGDQSERGQLPGPEPAADAATAPGSSRERDDAVAELARRLARIEKRVAALERGRPTAARVSGGDRGAWR